MDLSTAVRRKSSFSGSNGGRCADVATAFPGVIAVRDGEHPHGPALLFTSTTWHPCTKDIGTGQFDRLS